MIKPVLIFASDIAIDLESYEDLWEESDRFAVAILHRDGLEKAYGPTLFDQVSFRDLISELIRKYGNGK